jgi:hypothetical protein
MSTPIKIDKSVFTAEELETYNSLIAKATVDPAAAEEEMEEEKPTEAKKTEEPSAKDEVVEETKKSAAEAAFEAATERMEKLEKSIEMKNFSDIAKKYAALGEKEEDLANTLYEMKKSSEDNYNAYISVLDKSLAMVEKSGVFSEIGKSAGNESSVSGAVAKAEAKAAEIMKADDSIDYTTAIAKAWEDPALMAEYEAEIKG